MASAVIEAERFGTKYAVMVVHSFSQTGEWFSDYEAFVSLYGANVRAGQLLHLKDQQGISLYTGWVKGDARFLTA